MQPVRMTTLPLGVERKPPMITYRHVDPTDGLSL